MPACYNGKQPMSTPYQRIPETVTIKTSLLLGFIVTLLIGIPVVVVSARIYLENSVARAAAREMGQTMQQAFPRATAETKSLRVMEWHFGEPVEIYGVRTFPVLGTIANHANEAASNVTLQVNAYEERRVVATASITVPTVPANGTVAFSGDMVIPQRARPTTSEVIVVSSGGFAFPFAP